MVDKNNLEKTLEEEDRHEEFEGFDHEPSRVAITKEEKNFVINAGINGRYTTRYQGTLIYTTIGEIIQEIIDRNKKP